MADNWGKLILGVLAGAAIWKGIGPNGQQQVTDTLNTCAAEFQRIKQEELQKSLALLLQAVKDLPMEPGPVLPPIDLPVLPIPAAHPKMAVPVETDAHWREVLVAPAVVLILGSAHADSINKRPVFRQLLEDAAQGKFDVVVVHTLDRWSRNARIALESLATLARHSVALVSITENIDYSTAHGKLLTTMLAGFAEFFSDSLGTRSIKGRMPSTMEMARDSSRRDTALDGP